MSAKVVIYTTPTCPYCIRAKMLLDSKGVAYENIDLSKEAPEVRTALTERTGSRTVPQIFINEQFVGGCDDIHTLERQGKLDELLA